jgi:hypothetical protein
MERHRRWVHGDSGCDAVCVDRAHPGGGTAGIRAGEGWRSSVALILRQRLV